MHIQKHIILISTPQNVLVWMISSHTNCKILTGQTNQGKLVLINAVLFGNQSSLETATILLRGGFLHSGVHSIHVYCLVAIVWDARDRGKYTLDYKMKHRQSFSVEWSLGWTLRNWKKVEFLEQRIRAREVGGMACRRCLLNASRSGERFRLSPKANQAVLGF